MAISIVIIFLISLLVFIGIYIYNRNTNNVLIFSHKNDIDRYGWNNSFKAYI